jgi:hypothetical protein
MARQKKKSGSKLVAAVVVAAIAAVGIGVGAVAMNGNTSELPIIVQAQTYENPLTGQISEKELPARPLQVSIDNVGDAIPQSWLSKADIVYEFPVEGEQTRLQAIYYGQFPEEFGPIRSTRPYFVDLAREYKAVFLAHGWSPQAKRYLMTDVIPYINAMNSDCHFYRVSDKVAPHNSYIKWTEVKKKIDQQGWWSEKKDLNKFEFLNGGQCNEGKEATNIKFEYGAIDYSFKYDTESNTYTRSVFGDKHVDHETNKALTTYNVLVQKVKSKTLDNKGRLKIDMCAGGEAILFTNGVAVKGTWSRESLDSFTIFVDEEGNQMKLTRGNTWVEVVDQNCDLDY